MSLNLVSSIKKIVLAFVVTMLIMINFITPISAKSIDKKAPVIKLTHSTITITKGSKFSAKKYLKSVKDNRDGNLKSKVKISGKVNIKKAGTYKVKYTVSDKAKNKSAKTLKVKVIEKSKAQRIVSAAKSKLGSPYRYGSNGPKSFDCSGFTQWVYKQVGKKLPRSSSSQKRGGKLIKLSKAKVGDVVWRSGHVGIYIGNGKVIHSPHSGDVVRYTTLKGFKYAVRYL